jgi:hypothetical protein
VDVRILRTTLLAGAAAVLWFGLGMNGGVLLSDAVRGRVWPWAPFYPSRALGAPGLSDPVWQFAPWAEFAGAELRAGRLPLWNPHQDGGVPLLANAQSALGSPLLLPALALGVAGGWNLSLLLRLLVALGGAWALLRDRGRSPEAAALGAVAYALSGAFVAWLGHPQTLAAAPVPFVLLFAGRLARRASPRDALLLALSTAAVLAGGHPETALMAALLAAAWTLFLAASPRRVAATFGASLAGAGLAAPLWLPFAEYFFLSEARAGGPPPPVGLPRCALVRLVLPGAASANAVETAAAVSAAVVLLVPAGLALGRPRRESLFWAAAAAVILLVSYDNPAARLLARATPVYWSRALLLLPIPLGCLAAAGLDALADRARAAGRGRAARGVAVGLAAAAAIELLVAARGVHDVTPPGDLAVTTPLLERLEADKGVFRILPLHTFLPPNRATPLYLDDVRGYDALSPAGWRRTRAAIGRFRSAPTVSDVLEPWDLAPGGAGLDFWNVKYLCLHPQFPFGAATLNARLGLALEEIYSGPDGRLLRNRRVLPRARVEGAEGSVRLLERLPTRWVLDVSASAAGRLVVANPYFPGWHAVVDGVEAPLAAAPGDPIVLPVPIGSHRVFLEYRPASFRAGLALAAASVLALVLVARRR